MRNTVGLVVLLAVGGLVIGLGLLYLTGCGGGPLAPPIPEPTTTTVTLPAPPPSLPSPLPPDQP